MISFLILAKCSCCINFTFFLLEAPSLTAHPLPPTPPAKTPSVPASPLVSLPYRCMTRSLPLGLCVFTSSWSGLVPSPPPNRPPGRVKERSPWILPLPFTPAEAKHLASTISFAPCCKPLGLPPFYCRNVQMYAAWVGSRAAHATGWAW